MGDVIPYVSIILNVKPLSSVKLDFSLPYRWQLIGYEWTSEECSQRYFSVGLYRQKDMLLPGQMVGKKEPIICDVYNRDINPWIVTVKVLFLRKGNKCLSKLERSGPAACRRG